MSFNSVTNKDWELKLADKNKILFLREKFSISEILSRLLVLRNISIDQIESFLKPEINKHLIDPNLLLDMNKSVKLIIDDILNKKITGIFGDYDVDGASATAILIKFFNHINHNSKFYIPDRVNEGYGPSKITFKKLIDQKVSTIITVDCGTLSYEAIDFGNLNKVNTIVIDHHQTESKLPKAFGLINPNRVGDKSNLNSLCATSLVFIFLIALDNKLKKIDWYKDNNILPPNLTNMLDLVALATICDVVPLVGINRYFVQKGLSVIKERKNVGLNAISETCDLKTKTEEYHLGFLYGPRINAGGRLGFSSYGAKLLSTNDSNEANDLIIKLNKLNEERKKLEDSYLNKIYKIAEGKKNDSVLVIHDDSFHEGIIGILASRVKDRFNKPTIILSGIGNTLKASARSIYGFDIGLEILNLVENKIIIKGGGHKMAAGFTIDKKRIDDLKKYLNEIFFKKMKKKIITDKILIDAIISPSALNSNFYEEMNLMKPFGPGNSKPTFLIESLNVYKSTVLNNKHISSILVSKNKTYINAISFNSYGTLIHDYLMQKSKKINLVGKLNLNEWKGKKNIQLIIDDIAI